MFSRILIIFLVTGMGQICYVFALKYLVRHSPLEQVNSIVEIETIVQLIISLIAFGLQSAAIRDLSLLKDWKEEFAKVQSARLTLGLFLFLVCLFAFYDMQYLYFIVAPLLALNGDYALYARGYPIAGALIAFSRIFVPLLLSVVAFFYWPSYMASLYFLGIIFSFLFTNLIISKLLKTKFIFWPKFNNLLLYFKTIPLGTISLSLYFFGLGILFIADYVLDDSRMTIAFLALKFYLIYKGVLRVLHQAFIKNMTNDQICSYLDHLSFMIGLLYFSSSLIFPESFISIFFGEQFINQRIFFGLISFSALVYSLFLSMTTRALLDRADRNYFKLSIFSVVISIVCLFITNIFSKSINVLGFSLLAGEIIFSFGLGILFLKYSQIKMRIWFILKTIPVVTIPLFFRFWNGDTFSSYIVSFSLMGFLLAIFGYNMIKSVTLKEMI